MNYEKIRDEKYRSGLNKSLISILTRHSCRGISAAICGEASVLLKCAAGVRDGESCEPMTAESVFWADQLAAPVLAYLAWKLHEEGILDLNKPLSDYTAEPFLPGERNLNYITGRSVLSHTSGLPKRKSENGMPTHVEFMPTTLFSYSNYGLLYLQRAIESATKTDLQTLAEEKIFKPFRMYSSSFVWKAEFEDRFAHPHVKGAPLRKVRAEKPNASRYFYTTPTDYCLFLNKIFTVQTSQKCLAPLTLEKMLQPQTELYNGLKWTAGFGLCETKNGDLLWQFGDAEGSKTLAFIDRKNNTCTCVAVNDANGFHACQAFLRDALGESLEAWDKFDGISFDKIRYEGKLKAARKKYQ